VSTIFSPSLLLVNHHESGGQNRVLPQINNILISYFRHIPMQTSKEKKRFSRVKSAHFKALKNRSWRKINPKTSNFINLLFSLTKQIFYNIVECTLFKRKNVVLFVVGLTGMQRKRKKKLLVSFYDVWVR
jgi:hypothetical protein